MSRIPAVAFLALGLCSFSITGYGAGPTAPVPQLGWPVYGGQGAQDHYSTLSQINRAKLDGTCWKQMSTGDPEHPFQIGQTALHKRGT